MINIKRVLAIVLLVSPLTFWGQGKNTNKNKINAGDQPITSIEPGFNTGKKSSNYFYFNASAGPTILNGDNGKWELGIEGNLGFGYQLTEYLGFEGKLGFASFNGDFNNIKKVESFKSNAFEANVNVMLELTNLILGYKSNRKFGVTPHIGYGQIQYRSHIAFADGTIITFGDKKNNDNPEYNTELNQDGKIVLDKNDGTSFTPYGRGIGGRKVAAILPMGILLSYNFNENTRLHLDVISTKVFSDALDALPRGTHKDWFTTINVRVQCKFKKHKKVHSPCDNVFGDYKYKRR